MTRWADGVREGAPLACALILGAVVAFGASAGCGLPTGALVVYTVDDPELAHASIGPAGIWESVPWAAPDAAWASYPPRATVQLEHTLGYVPTDVDVYLSFERLGSEPAEAAGDLARIVAVDASTITLRNETNAQFYVRVTAQ